jgi:DNA-binding Lrp family transcriptional regulator
MAATKAFVLIETAVGKTKDVVGALRQVSAVTSVDVVTGPYDIIAVVEAGDLAAVGDTVTGNVHTIGGIVRTVTCLVVGSPG